MVNYTELQNNNINNILFITISYTFFIYLYYCLICFASFPLLFLSTYEFAFVHLFLSMDHLNALTFFFYVFLGVLFKSALYKSPFVYFVFMFSLLEL